MNPSDDQKLEQLISRVVRDLPARRAPVTLESRVLQAIAAREAQPWWRKSFVHWPFLVRALFLVLSATLAAGTVWLLLRALGAVPVAEAGEIVSAPLIWWQTFNATVHTLVDLTLRVIPPGAMTWIQIALGAIAVGYGIVIGAGAAAYHALRQAR